MEEEEGEEGNRIERILTVFAEKVKRLHELKTSLMSVVSLL